MNKISLLTLLLLSFLFCTGQKVNDLNINFMLRGNMYAKSSIVDKDALGGFGGSENYPRKLDNKNSIDGKGMVLFIDTSEIISINGRFNGYQFFIVNKTDSIIRFDASDSRLPIIAEAFVDGRWQAIEYLPNSWCGNSYHSVYLKQDEFWSFQVPKFGGNISTRIRYRLTLHGNGYVFSNEIIARINKKQLSVKEGHEPSGIMDPYTD